MDGGAKESSRAGDRARRSGQQRVHRRIGGAVALRARVEAPPALARDRREDREEAADGDDREARRVPRAGLRLVGLRPERRRQDLVENLLRYLGHLEVAGLVGVDQVVLEVATDVLQNVVAVFACVEINQCRVLVT